MKPVYIIREWDKNFECSQSRKVTRELSWVATPCKHDGKTFRRLMMLPDGMEIYGAWILIVQIAAKCSTRGILADQDGPLDAEDMAIKTGGPKELFEKALKVLSESRIGWIQIGVWERSGIVLPPPTNQPTEQTVPTNQPPNPPTPPGAATNADPQAGGLAGRIVFSQDWEGVAQRLASIGVVKWSQSVSDAKACGCTPRHAHDLIDHAKRYDFGPGAIAKRFAIASPSLGVEAGWPNSNRPEITEAARIQKSAAKRAQHAAERAEQEAWRLVKEGRARGDDDEVIRALCESRGLPWPNPAKPGPPNHKPKARRA